MSDKNFDFPAKKMLIKTIIEFSKSSMKADDVFFVNFAEIQPQLRANANSIFKCLLRNYNLFENVILNLCRKNPKNKLFALLKAATADIDCRQKEKTFQVVDSWVEFAKKEFSKQESGFINAVLRKVPNNLEDRRKFLTEKNSVKAISELYGHPLWIVEKWISMFGLDETLHILKISQKPSEVFFIISNSEQAIKFFEENAENFKKSKFDNFYILESGKWNNIKSVLKTNIAYVQDPSTSIAVSLLKPTFDESVLDLCAAPGGKSRTIIDKIIQSSGYNPEKLKNSMIVSVDSGKERMKLLAENMSVIKDVKNYQIECNLLEDNLKSLLEKNSLNLTYDCVFLDAPCSNTGVLRRRPDARLRISQKDVEFCKEIQLKMMDIASSFVKSNGRFVYSTCSIDIEENEANVEKFLKKHSDFKLIEGKTYLPDEENDGCGAFLLQKIN